MNEASFRKRLEDIGFSMKPLPRESFAEVVRAWDAKWQDRLPDLKALREFTR